MCAETCAVKRFFAEDAHVRNKKKGKREGEERKERTGNELGSDGVRKIRD